MKVEYLEFITFCVGSLAEALNKSASQIYNALRSSGVLEDYIIPCYDVLHTFSKASTVVIEKPDVLHSRDKLDFGKGFYLTAIREQALRYAERFTLRGKDAYVNEYDFDEVTSGFVI